MTCRIKFVKWAVKVGSTFHLRLQEKNCVAFSTSSLAETRDRPHTKQETLGNRYVLLCKYGRIKRHKAEYANT